MGTRAAAAVLLVVLRQRQCLLKILCRFLSSFSSSWQIVTFFHSQSGCSAQGIWGQDILLKKF